MMSAVGTSVLVEAVTEQLVTAVDVGENPDGLRGEVGGRVR